MICDIEFKEIITHDGERFHLHDATKRWIMSHSGFGMPPINRVTERGYGQHGVSVLGRYLGERLITLDLGKPGVGRLDYWEERRKLCDFMRPNRGGPFQFLTQNAAGEWRWIYAELQEGLVFTAQDPSGDLNSFLVREPLVLACADPVWYGARHTITGVLAAVGQLVFPIVFPIWFGWDTILLTQAVAYAGTWQSRPTVTVTGPCASLSLQNVTLDVDVGFCWNIPAGVTLTVRFTDTGVLVTADDGNYYGGSMLGDSSAADFVIAPHPTAPNGVNNIVIAVGDATVNTRVALTYYERYVAF